ncbi:uncharacterized protein LOC142538740 [Primulina tabacum]|uniref:uncharacterized protein LOC142538740 n=1 Tax=Primulina tabacum TaxID=48773 RepID=UPI003F5913FB
MPPRRVICRDSDHRQEEEILVSPPNQDPSAHVLAASRARSKSGDIDSGGFQEVFFEKCFTADVHSRLKREFMSLHQGDSSVAKFVKKFDRGCHFVPLIANDAAVKLRHFLDGISPTVRRDMLLGDPTSYNDAFTRAFRAEKSLKDIEWEMQRKSPPPQQQSQQSKKSFTGPPKQPGQKKQQGQPPREAGTYKCFKSGGSGHKAADLSKKKQPTTGKAYVMHAEQAEPETTLIIGRIFLADIDTYALLDSGATHSFIFESFVKRLKILPKNVESGFKVTVPSGEHMVSKSLVKDVEFKLQIIVVRAYQIVLPMPEFDIILGMDWITLNGANIDFQQRSISVRLTNGKSFIFEAAQSKQLPHIISCISAKKLILRSCQGFLSSIIYVHDIGS